MKTRLAVLLVLGFFVSAAQAATEYLRFQGLVNSDYDDSHQNYDSQLGLTADQAVYFDFAIDTTLEAPGFTDDSFQDFFFAIYRGGSVSGQGVRHGVTNSYPEGLNSALYIASALTVGTTWDSLDNPSDESIDTWIVGKQIALMNGGDFSDNVIGRLNLTYRGAAVPPPVVPVPASAWLFASALAIVGWVRRRAPGRG